MKVIISVGGRFHAFNLAQQLEKKGFLSRLITSYPKFETEKYGIPKEKIKSILIKELMERGWRKLPESLKNLWNPQFLIHETFDKLAVGNIVSSDLFVGWSSFSLHSLRRAKTMGAVTILDRGSSHIVYQRDIIKEEYAKCGIEMEPTHPKIVEKELKEYEEADYIAIPSFFAKKSFLDKGVPEKKIIHVPYGVDLSDFRQIQKGDNVFRIVYVGAMSIRKGVHYLLQAFSELNLPNSELLLVGSKLEEIDPYFKKYQGHFKWIGSVPQKELYRYYSEGSVSVLNSIEDGFGMVIMQAMACGLPMICSENTGAYDIIEENKEGFIIPVGDVQALKEKINFLYENLEICQAMGEAAKKKVKLGFTWDDYGAKMIKAYQSILEK